VTGNILQTAYLSVYDFFQALYGILAMSVLVFLLYMQVPLHFEVLFIVRFFFLKSHYQDCRDNHCQVRGSSDLSLNFSFNS
jgi:hypothetical protein